MNKQTQEALTMAQEVLNLYCEQLNSTFANDALKAIDEALEQPADAFCDSNCVWSDHHPDCVIGKQPAQEPNCYGDGNVYRGLRSEDSKVKTYHVNTHPHRWQGLTDDEIVAKVFENDELLSRILYLDGVSKALKQALKEKNCGI